MTLTFSSNEAERLQALRQYDILDTECEQEFDELARLATSICRVPIALISFVDTERVWFKSRLEFRSTQIPRDKAFCAAAILQPDLFVVSDASTDERFTDSSFVSESGIKFYAGMPLVTREGYVLGTLCVMDHKPRKLTGEQKQALQTLARQVIRQLDLRSSLAAVANVSHKLDLEIIERRRAQELTEDKEARLRCVFDSNLIGIVFVNACGEITQANEAFLKLAGYTRDDLLSGALSWPTITDQSCCLPEEAGCNTVQALEVSKPAESECIRKDGRRIPILMRSTPLEKSGEEFVCFVLDLTGHKQAQEKVDYLAYYDALTHLPNQLLFKDRLQHALALTRRNDQPLAVMLVNLDRFKVINDTLGYPAGDWVLQEVAERLIKCVAENDTVARFGTDEFALLLTQVNSTEDAAKIAEEIKRALNLPFRFHDQDLFITVGIGISLHPHDGQDTLGLLKSAGTALYRAKEQDGNSYEFYAPGRTTKALKQLLLENNLRPGLERGEFVVHYQPQVDIDTAQLVGMEALLRWQHPGLGLLYPAEFIALAEDSGLIVPIGEWVLRTACNQSRLWQDAGFDPLRMAVNLSARQFQQPKLVDTVAEALEESGLNPHWLELELTERSIMKNPDQVIGKLHELKRTGLHISIDDFGTGYSSLSYLKRFPIDTLKIDQSFVREITTDADDAAIVTAIITLAHALKLKVIAEGVETPEQLEFLRTLQCDEVQGFLFSTPLSAEEFTLLLMERRRLQARTDYSTNRLPPLPSHLQPLA